MNEKEKELLDKFLSECNIHGIDRVRAWSKIEKIVENNRYKEKRG